MRNNAPHYDCWNILLLCGVSGAIQYHLIDAHVFIKCAVLYIKVVLSDRYLNRGSALGPRTSSLESWGKVIP